MNFASLRKRLIKEKTEIEKYLKSQLDTEGKIGEDWSSPKDLEDWAYVTRMENNFSIKSRKKLVTLKEIEHAIKKMDQGKYGVCENCGKPIEMERLELLPWTRYCAACAMKNSKTL